MISRYNVVFSVIFLTLVLGISIANSEDIPVVSNGDIPAANSEDIPDAVSEEYTIGAGDVLDISVWKNADLSRTVVVLPDDSIRFPLIGEIKVGGQSVAWVEENIKSSLEKYIPDPVLSVSLTQTGSMVIYVIGKVNSPGKFALNDTIDVLQALAVCGGLNAFAKEKEIKIFRKHSDGTTIFNFNYDAVSEGLDLEQNIMLQRGDVIVVR